MLAAIVLMAVFLGLRASASPADAASQVFVVRRGWHIDVGFAARELELPLRSIVSDLPQARFVLFGFGDMRYLLSKNHGSSSLAAALWPGRGIMLVTGLKNAPEQGFGSENVIELKLSARDALALQTAIRQSFVAEGDEISVYRAGPYEGSLYYRAVADYSAIHTCNTWAAQMLKAAGFKVHTRGTVFAGQLWSQVKRLNAAALRAPSMALGPG